MIGISGRSVLVSVVRSHVIAKMRDTGRMQEARSTMDDKEQSPNCASLQAVMRDRDINRKSEHLSDVIFML